MLAAPAGAEAQAMATEPKEPKPAPAVASATNTLPEATPLQASHVGSAGWSNSPAWCNAPTTPSAPTTTSAAAAYLAPASFAQALAEHVAPPVPVAAQAPAPEFLTSPTHPQLPPLLQEMAPPPPPNLLSSPLTAPSATDGAAGAAGAAEPGEAAALGGGAGATTTSAMTSATTAATTMQRPPGSGATETACAICAQQLYGVSVTCCKCASTVHAQCAGLSAQDVTRRQYTCTACQPKLTRSRPAGNGGGGKRGKLGSGKSSRATLQQNLMSLV